VNALVRSNLDRLAESVGQLARLVTSAHARMEAQTAEKERVARETWNKDRKAAILEDNVARMNEVMEENRQLREKQAAATEHAAKLLAHVRELQEKFTP
jgi:hypothetical protein